MVSKNDDNDIEAAVPQVIRKIYEMNDMVVAKINKTQELCLIAAYEKESTEYRIKKSFEERISNIAAWHWVLKDLSRRLDDAIDALRHEKDAVLVVIERLKGEIQYRVEKSSRPGILAPRSDAVEEAIFKEYKYLLKQKSMFAQEALNLDDLIVSITEAKDKIYADLKRKEIAMAVEEACMNFSHESRECDEKSVTARNKKKKVTAWEKRCEVLKSIGLRALKQVAEERASVRGARARLSCGAGARAARVHAALRRRLHANTLIMQELQWQTNEALDDLKRLEEEREITENTILELLGKARESEARSADRSRRPAPELTRDEVDTLLKRERAQLKRNIKKFQENLNNIISLQNNLTKVIMEMDNRVADVKHILQIDEARMRDRQAEDGNQENEFDKHMDDGSPSSNCGIGCNTDNRVVVQNMTPEHSNRGLDRIIEEDEDDVDDYPFDF